MLTRYFLDSGFTFEVDNFGEVKYHQSVKEVLEPENIVAVNIKDLRSLIPEVYKETAPEVSKVGDLCKIAGDGLYEFRGQIETKDLSLKILESHNVSDTKMFLNEDECETLGIKYREKLVALNSSVKLNPYSQMIKEFDMNDLETYPASREYEDIKYMLIKLSGFKKGPRKLILTPNGHLIDPSLFLATLKVSVTKYIPGVCGVAEFKVGEDIPWSIVWEDFTGSKKEYEGEDMCDINGDICILLSLTKGKEKGVSPIFLRSCKASDVFSVSWDVTFDKLCPYGGEKAEGSLNSLIYKDDLFEEKDFERSWRRIGRDNKMILAERDKGFS